jgi:DNA-binding response OmpR family regulator
MNDKLAGKRILIVEDEYFIASDLKRLLEEADVDVVGPVGNLTAGLTLAENERLDAALLDVNREGAFSYQIADRLTRDKVPLIFVTGYDNWALPEQYRDLPSVAKPFRGAAIVDMMARLCGDPQ